MDGADAAAATLKMFRSIGNPIGFRVTTVGWMDDYWEVECEFYPWLGADKVARYKVQVSDEGRVTDVREVSAAP